MNPQLLERELFMGNFKKMLVTISTPIKYLANHKSWSNWGKTGSGLKHMYCGPIRNPQCIVFEEPI